MVEVRRCWLISKFVTLFAVLTKVKWISWDPPPESMMKLNVDGASKGSSGMSGGGMVLGNSAGQVVLAAAAFYGEGSNMNAECRALLDGLKLVLKHDLGMHQFLIESDSQILVQMVLKKVKVPWRLKNIMDQIWQMLGRLSFQLKHVYREANGIADFLASFVVQTGVSTDFSINRVLPAAGRVLLLQD